MCVLNREQCTLASERLQNFPGEAVKPGGEVESKQAEVMIGEWGDVSEPGASF